jgi:UDP-N-acetylmuramate dehydrogenase
VSTSILVQENVPLAPFTTLKIGGKARFFVSASSDDEVIAAFDLAKANDLALFVLGGGSNVLIADEGFDGLVLQVALKGVSSAQEKDGTLYVTAQAGEDWDGFVRYCVERDLQGLECLSGIPGFAGGTPVQNVGAYGQEVSESIVSVHVFDRKDGEVMMLANADCGFAYRTSIFNTVEKERYIVLSVTYALKLAGAPKIVYKDLIEHFGSNTPTLRETRDAVIDIRRAKSMVIDEGDPNSRSAGSFFKNPIVSSEEFDRVEKAAEGSGFGKVPSFPAGDGLVKVPAAWLIERSGFSKGFEYGRAGLSTKHTLALINRGGACAADILALKDLIQAQVNERFSIELQTEPVFVGF